MGKRARRKRAEEKRLARWFGIREDELGRLHKRMTKAEARRRLVQEHALLRSSFLAHRWKIEHDLVEIISRKAHEDICAQEDARVLAELDQICRWHTEQANTEFRRKAWQTLGNSAP